MSTRDRYDVDPDDLFADTRMTFGDHIEDLRTHLIRALKGFLVALVLSFYPLTLYVMDIITAPVREQVTEFHLRRINRIKERIVAENKPAVETEQIHVRKADLLRVLGKDGAKAERPDGPPEDEFVVLTVRRQRDLETLENKLRELRLLQTTLTTLSAQEGAVIYIKVALLTSLVFASPWVFYQIWSFIAAGLYPHEKKLVHVYLPFSLGLFVGGVLLCQFYVMPAAVRALLWFNELMDINPDLRLSEWLGFAIMLPLVFGVSFQTPVVMYFLFRIGLVELETFRGKRKLAWFLMAIFAAFITPTPDPVNMMFLWLPMGLLYELGIWLCRMAPPSPWESEDVPEPEEPVEV